MFEPTIGALWGMVILAVIGMVAVWAGPRGVENEDARRMRRAAEAVEASDVRGWADSAGEAGLEDELLPVYSSVAAS